MRRFVGCRRGDGTATLVAVTAPPDPPAAPAPRAPAPADPRRWGLGDVIIGLVGSQVIGGLLGVLVASALGYDVDFDGAPGWALALGILPLQLILLGTAWAAAELKGRGVIEDFKATMKPKDISTGVIAGVGSQVVLLPIVYIPLLWLLDRDSDDVGEAARELTDRADSPMSVIGLIFALAIAAPVVEEYFFRGLLFRSLDKRRNLPWLGDRTLSPGWNRWFAIVVSSVVFGAIHLQALQFPALVIFGGVAAWLVHRYDRLGPAIWAHIAFNGTTLAFNLL